MTSHAMPIEMRIPVRIVICAALAAANGKVFGDDGAARLLQIPPTTLFSRMKSHGLK